MSLIEVVSEELSALGAFPLSFEVEEGISANAHYQLDIACRSAAGNFDALLGKNITITIEQPGGCRRPFNAWIVAVGDRGQRGNHFVYGLRLSGWLWFLQQNRNCRIFQNLSVPDIVTQIFSRYGMAQFRLQLETAYPLREYCVQFAESDFDFVSRLLEDEGISYVTEHREDRHTLVVQDRQVFPPLAAPYHSQLFTPDGEEGRAIREGIQQLRLQRKICPNETVLRDFDYLNPRRPLQTQAERQMPPLAETPLQWYDYATGYRDTERGERLAQIRLQELQGQGQLLDGESNCTGLLPAHRFMLSLHPDPQRNRGYKLLRCDYTFIQDGPDSSSQGRNILCRFVAIADDVAWRPLRVTPSPQLPALQSATVVGPPGAEVHTDRHGRIRVHFHWDRDKSDEEDCSCWIRVVQAWVGKGWGVLALPRVGQEVLITYLDGSPDRPVVTGMVYNGDNPPPYRLPQQINYSGLVSRSLNSGQPQHASQLTFDDKRGNERVMLHAERDLQSTVERNSVTDVGQDVYQNISRTLTQQLQNAVSYQGNDVSLTGNSVTATGNQAEQVGNSVSLTGNSLSFTGSDTGFTVMSSTVTGTSTSVTGSSISSTGCESSRTGASTSVTGTDCNFTAFSTSFLGVGTSFTAASTDMTGNAVVLTGSSTEFYGAQTTITGQSVALNASSVTTTGSEVTTTGSSVTHTGTSVSHTGTSISTTGTGISTTDTEVSSMGSSMETVGVKMSN